MRLRKSGSETLTQELDEISIEITNYSPLFDRQFRMKGKGKRHELPAPLIVRMMEELLECYKIEFVSITGGEPFLYDDFDHLFGVMLFFRETRKIGGLGVYSNVLYFEKVRSLFSAFKDNLSGVQIGINIDGDEKMYDRSRGVGAYQETIRTVKWLEKFCKNVVLQFKFTINRTNYAELSQVYDLARRFNTRFSPKMMEFEKLTPEMTKSVVNQLKAILKDDYPGINRQLIEAAMVLLAGGKKCIRACETPARTLFINSRREVFPCLNLPSAGKVDSQGRLPQKLDEVRRKYADAALEGRCCFSCNGFLKKFNLKHLQDTVAALPDMVGGVGPSSDKIIKD